MAVTWHMKTVKYSNLFISALFLRWANYNQLLLYTTTITVYYNYYF